MEFLLHTPDITNHNIGSVSWNVCHSCILQEKIWILQDRTGWKSFITGFPQGFVFEVSSVDFIRHWIWEGMFLILKKKVFFAIENWAHSTRRWRKERNGTTGKEWGEDKHPPPINITCHSSVKTKICFWGRKCVWMFVKSVRKAGDCQDIGFCFLLVWRVPLPSM